MSNFIEYLEESTLTINRELRRYLDSMPRDEYGGQTAAAIEYAVMPGGKRLRPLFMMAVCDSLNGEAARALPFACALEMIHQYSLIHDDLPSMDDDDTRRGRPSCHIRFGEAAAILAGDGLLTFAFEIMAQACVDYPAIEAASAMHELARAAGIAGMVGGQAADVINDNHPVTKDALRYIHSRKTAALFAAAAAAAARLSRVEDIKGFRAAGEILGLAFQIMDDLQDPDEFKSGKNTYISVFGLETARADYDRYSAEALDALARLCGNGSKAWRLAKHIQNR